MTTKADTSVKWFHSGMTDAPALSGQTDKLIELLDACLINGFGARTPDSITVSGGVATVAISAGNPYEEHTVISISGASVAALNAEWRIDTAAASSFTFLCPGVADGAATGATVKRAGAGWSKPFSAANTAVYRSAVLGGSQLYLRVNDANARFARVRGYEQMTDVDTGVDPFPTLAQLAESSYTWPKSDAASSATRPWALFSDGQIVYFLPAFAVNGSAAGGHSVLWFGDLLSANPANDAFQCVIAAHATATPTAPTTVLGSADLGVNSNGLYMARGLSQTNKSVQHDMRGPRSDTTPDLPGRWGDYADGQDWAVYAGIIVPNGWPSSGVRGVMPGYAFALQRAIAFGSYQLREIDGRQWCLIMVGAQAEVDPGRFVLIDITRPWR